MATVRTPVKQYLDVYLNNKFVGKLCSDNAILSFAYDAQYLLSDQPTKLSAALPLQAEAFEHKVVAPFFSNLLPDEDVRRRLATYLRISAKNTFALLKEIGGECAGAIALYPEGQSPQLQSAQTYLVFDEDKANDVLTALDKRPMMAGTDNVRISGAGAQDKLMVAFVDGKMAIPTGATPSTHIIKPPIKGLEEPVQNEYFCMRLAALVGLPVPQASIYWLKGQPYYLVERYDRVLSGQGAITRLHQEDFCQALQCPPEMKYQDEGGPTMTQLFALLDERIRLGAMAGKNKITLLQGIIFNYMIGNGDAHGKNFSLLYKEQAEELAPFYDLLSTVVYGDAYKAKMAMKIGSKYKFKQVSMRHWQELGELIGFKPEFVKKQVVALADTIANKATTLCAELNSNPQLASPIYQKIVDVVLGHKRRLISGDVKVTHNNL